MSAESTPSWAKNLSWRERVFVEEYLTDLNAFRAYQRAGLASQDNPNSHRAMASAILARPNVAEAIERLLQERAVTRQALVSDIAAMRFRVNIADYLDFDGENIKYKSFSELDTDQLKRIAGLSEQIDPKTGKKTIKFEFYDDRKWACEKLMKILRMEVTRTEISGPNGGPVEVTDPIDRMMADLDTIAKRNHDAAVGKPESA